MFVLFTLATQRGRERSCFRTSKMHNSRLCQTKTLYRVRVLVRLFYSFFTSSSLASLYVILSSPKPASLRLCDFGQTKTNAFGSRESETTTLKRRGSVLRVFASVWEGGGGRCFECCFSFEIVSLAKVRKRRSTQHVRKFEICRILFFAILGSVSPPSDIIMETVMSN